jgi:hypothetical protein
MKKMTRFLVLALGTTLSILSSAVYADPPVPPFYEEVIKMSPDGKLGQILKKEKIKTSVKGAQAWKIAYVTSDVGGRKHLATGLVVAPIGTPPKEGRPIMAWVMGQPALHKTVVLHKFSIQQHPSMNTF